MNEPTHPITALWNAGALPFATRPRLVKPLSGGLSNASFLIEAYGRQCVARIAPPGNTYPGIDPKREQAVLQMLQNTALAPPVIHHDPTRNLLITEYLPGRHWRQEDSADQALTSKLLQKARQLHTLPFALEPLDYPAHAQKYLQRLQESGQKPTQQTLRQHQQICAQLAKIHYPPQLCHHDLNPTNILITANNIYLLDWEYAAPGWPLFDYACLHKTCGIPMKIIKQYTAAAPTEFSLAEALLNHISKLWELLHERPTEFPLARE